VFVWLCGRSSGGAGLFGVENDFYGRLRISHEEYQVSGGERPFSVQHFVGQAGFESAKGVLSTRHMKMKLPDLSGKVIVIKSDQ